ncbi:MAG TPA: hypothetical protein VNA68_00675 [Candidatus Dormibacteraeota bacterium]|nr:hypothetical protein [Candidatus Dormibacteraeota bacterium]
MNLTAVRTAQGTGLLPSDEFEAEVEELNYKRGQAQAYLNETHQRAQELKEIKEILAALPRCWNTADPGKYGAHYTFMDSDGYPLLVELLLPEEVEVAENRRLVQTLAEVKHEECPSCGASQPLIRSYEQTFDSVDGDTWEKKYFVICCGKVQIIGREVKDHRF